MDQLHPRNRIHKKERKEERNSTKNSFWLFKNLGENELGRASLFPPQQNENSNGLNPNKINVFFYDSSYFVVVLTHEFAYTKYLITIRRNTELHKILNIDMISCAILNCYALNGMAM